MTIIAMVRETSQNDRQKAQQIIPALENNESERNCRSSVQSFLYFCTVKIYPKLSGPY